MYTKKVVYPAQNSSSSGVYDYKKFEFGDDGHFKELTRVDFEAVIGGKKAPGFLLDNVETITCYP